MCKCWPAPGAAGVSCNNCTAPNTFFLDQTNIVDTNFWTNSGDPCTAAGTPPYYIPTGTTANATLQPILSSAFLTVSSIFAQYKVTASVRGVVGGTFTGVWVKHVATTNGKIRVQIDMTTAGSPANQFKARIQVFNTSGGVLYTATDLLMGNSPFTGLFTTGSILINVLVQNPATYDVYHNGVKVVSAYVAGGDAAAQRVVIAPAWADTGNYAGGGANSFQQQSGLRNIMLVAATGLPYSCCG